MAAMDPGEVVFQVEKVLCIRREDTGVEVVRTRNRNGRLIVILGGTVHSNSGEGKRRVGRDARTDPVVT